MYGNTLMVIDRTTGGFSTWDVPRAVLTPAVLEQIIADARKDRCLALYCSPITEFSILNSQFSRSHRHEQPDATLIVDLSRSEEEILAGMHQKARYNIKVAEKHGVQVIESTDTAAYAALARETAVRDGFRAPSERHFAAFLRCIPGSFLLLAIHEGKPIAGLIGAVWQDCGIYYYGASSYAHRALMAPYLLQWEAMRRCKAAGCLHYDLLGIAPPGAPANHPWQGITAFKEKWGGKLVTYPHEVQLTLRPVALAVLQLKRKLLG